MFRLFSIHQRHRKQRRIRKVSVECKRYVHLVLGGVYEWSSSSRNGSAVAIRSCGYKEEERETEPRHDQIPQDPYICKANSEETYNDGRVKEEECIDDFPSVVPDVRYSGSCLDSCGVEEKVDTVAEISNLQSSPSWCFSSSIAAGAQVSWLAEYVLSRIPQEGRKRPCDPAKGGGTMSDRRAGPSGEFVCLTNSWTWLRAPIIAFYLISNKFFNTAPFKFP
ncbi:hypothetical protein VNO77_03169 [Canavalia gladiata]|uniref:Uncharacterized protein n=1 Tax=Canavalia gladiata TaxID=3824 RepID=A0AAN9MV05_CANGL